MKIDDSVSEHPDSQIDGSTRNGTMRQLKLRPIKAKTFSIENSSINFYKKFQVRSYSIKTLKTCVPTDVTKE